MTASTAKEFAARSAQARPFAPHIVLRLPDLSPAVEPPCEPAAPLRQPAVEPPARSPIAAAAAPWPAPAASTVHSTDDRAAAALPELGRAAEAVSVALHGGRFGRIAALLGSWGGLLVRPEARWLLAAAGLARAVMHIRAKRKASSETANANAPAGAEEQTKYVRLMQALAQPNALLAAVLALACVLLAVVLQTGRQRTATDQPRAQAPREQHGEWTSPLDEAVVEPQGAAAPPFLRHPADVPPPQEAPQAPAAVPSDPPTVATADAMVPPPMAPAPPETRLPESANRKTPPSPHAARRLPPTAAVNEPLALPGQKQPPRQFHVFPERPTDRYGMPVAPPAANPFANPPQPPKIEPPPGGFDAIGPQAVYPMRDTQPAAAPASTVAPQPTYVAERLPRPGQEPRGARLRGIIQP